MRERPRDATVADCTLKNLLVDRCTAPVSLLHAELAGGMKRKERALHSGVDALDLLALSALSGGAHRTRRSVHLKCWHVINGRQPSFRHKHVRHRNKRGQKIQKYSSGLKRVCSVDFITLHPWQGIPPMSGLKF